MTTASRDSADQASGGTQWEAWEAIRADPDIQFAPVQLPATPREPGIIERILDYLGELFAPAAGALVANWSIIWPLLAGAGALLAALLAARILMPRARARRARADETVARFAPARSAALALLTQADLLAEAGHYEEATHLLLIRSVEQIGAIRPDLVEPSSTAREISRSASLPELARTAFAVIADRVERSLFALDRLSREDWLAARSAYADFALAADEAAHA